MTSLLGRGSLNSWTETRSLMAVSVSGENSYALGRCPLLLP